MDIIILDKKEREKFAAYLEQEAIAEKGLYEQMEKIMVHENIIKRMKVKEMACVLIAGILRNTEDMTLQAFS